jgi:glycerophosphoryl diester phosphodiesterase
MPAPALRAPSAAPVLWARRGASAFAAENTHAAFALAIEHGADGVELDVRDAACGTVVVVHDPTLARVAAGHRGVVAAMTAAELGAVDLVAPDGSRTRGVPRLDDALDQVLAAGLALNIEIKGDVPDRMRLSRRVLRVLHRRSARERERIVISSSHPRTVDQTELDAVLARSAVPVLVEFSATWCGPCRAQEPVLHEVAEQFGDRARVLVVDVDKSPELAARFGVRSVPTLVVVRIGRSKTRTRS